MTSTTQEDNTLSYRRALGSFATGVVVITTEEGGQTFGLTVNSFTSVSLEPPLVLWCLGDESDRYALFSRADRFVVNVLPASARDVSERFARTGGLLLPDDLATPDGQPSQRSGLKGALTCLACVTRDRIGIGDHLVIVGEVEAFETRDGDGLVYFRSQYGRAVVQEA